MPTAGNRAATTNGTVPFSGHAYGTYLDLDATDAPAVFEAMLDRSTYEVTFDANGESGADTSMSFVCGWQEPLPASTFTRGGGGYAFAGWNTRADGTGGAYEDAATVRDIYPSYQDRHVTLYAQWRPIEFGGTETDPGNQDSDGDGYGDNLSFSIPTSLVFAAKADGLLPHPIRPSSCPSVHPPCPVRSHVSC